MNDIKRLDKVANWYLEEESIIDKKFIKARYDAIRLYFKGDRCLELGPAQGQMTQYIVNDFKDVTLIDSSQALLNNIPEYPNVNKIKILFEEFETKERFDTIIFDHVLEHVENPIQILRKISEWLNINGVLIVGVPNGNSIHRHIGVEMGLLDKCTQLNEQDFSLGHRRVYTMNSFKEDLLAADYKVLHLGGVSLKVLSNKQIEQSWSQELIDAVCNLGYLIPNYAGDIFAVCKRGDTSEV